MEEDDIFEKILEMLFGRGRRTPGFRIFKINCGVPQEMEISQFDKVVVPLTEIVENHEKYEIILEMPGVDLEDIDWSVTNRELTIIGNGVLKKYNHAIDLQSFQEIDWNGGVSVSVNNGIVVFSLKKLVESKNE